MKWNSVLPAFLSLAVFCLIFLASHFVQADQATGLLSEAIYHKLAAVQKLIEEEKPAEALQSLDILLPLVKEDPYASAVVYQTYGFAYIRLDDYQKAAHAFKRALALNKLPEKTTRQIEYDLAQLYIASGHYEEGVEVLALWFGKTLSHSSEAHALAASGYIELKKYHEAIPHLRQAISGGSTPNEQWHQSLLALYSKLNQQREAVSLLEAMILHFPDRSRYWVRLSHLYMTLKEETKAFNILELAYLKDLLQEKEILRLADLYISHRLPYRAGTVLARGLSEGVIAGTKENWERASIAWLEAKETDRALLALEHAADLSNDGRLTLKRSGPLDKLKRWEAAKKSLEK